MSIFAASNVGEKVEFDHPFSDKFAIRLNPLSNGSCMFESLSDQLSTIGIMISHEELRSAVVSMLADNPFTRDGTHLKNFITVEWDLYLKAMSDCSTYGDHLTLEAVAKLYDIQLVIVSSLGQQFTNFISPISTNSGSYSVQFDHAILFLGHYAETGDGLMKQHYVSLKWRGTSDTELHEFLESVPCTQDVCALTEVNVSVDSQLQPSYDSLNFENSTVTPSMDNSQVCVLFTCEYCYFQLFLKLKLRGTRIYFVRD